MTGVGGGCLFNFFHFCQKRQVLHKTAYWRSVNSPLLWQTSWRQLIPTKRWYPTTKPHVVTFTRKRSSFLQPSESQISITFNIYKFFFLSGLILCINGWDRQVATFWSSPLPPPPTLPLTQHLWRCEMPPAQLGGHKNLYLLRSVLTDFCQADPAATEQTDTASR